MAFCHTKRLSFTPNNFPKVQILYIFYYWYKMKEKSSLRLITVKKTRMHSSRMRTTRSSSHLGGVLHQAPPGPDCPRSRQPPLLGPDPPGAGISREQASSGAGTLPQSRHPPKSRHPFWSRHPPVNRMTNRCKNITLPQTSFAGSNYIFSSDRIE